MQVQTLMTGITEILEKNTNFKVLDNEAQEGYEKSCFFLYIDQVDFKSANVTTMAKVFEILIQFQKGKNNKLLVMGSDLAKQFKPHFFIDSIRLIPENFQMEVRDNNLFISFNLTIYERYKNDSKNNVMMGEFALNIDDKE